MKIKGSGWWLLRKDGLIVSRGSVDNIVTEVGRRYFAERAANITGMPAQITGAQLGTGTALPTGAGAGSAIGAYIAGTSVATAAGYPAVEWTIARARRVIWRFYWPTGALWTATEIVMHNQAVATDAAAPEANTIARALLAPAVQKPADQEYEFFWQEDVMG